jgi:hypothetical protein
MDLFQNNKLLVPKDYKWKTYIKLNDDLQNSCITKEDAIKHFLLYGKNENRKYKVEIPIGFDWKEYLNINEDIKNSKYNSEKGAKYHFINYGFFENRSWCLINKKEDLFNKFTEYNYDSMKKKSDILKIQNNINIKNYYNTRDTSYLKYNKIKNINKDKDDYCKNKILDLFSDYFILIIDFPKLGGGTTQFINSIISKYKKTTIFYILRNIENKVEVSINDEYVLNKTFDEFEILTYLQNKKKYIIKIFINHYLNHKKQLMNEIFNLEKEVTYITHDYYSISKEPQVFFHEISNEISNEITNEINDRSFYVSKCNNIVLQNEKNLPIFRPFIKDNSNVIICPLPDFKKSLNRITIKGNKIVIGVIGAISTHKGSELFKHIINYIDKYNNDIEVIIFGKTNFDYEKSFYYNDVNELNDLLIKYKPNMLLELSLWPETYSYTLTLSMLTQLPILILKKKILSVVEDRISNYTKTYFFKNIQELEILIYKVRQDYFYTIDPIVYYKPFWDDYFQDSQKKIMENKINFDNIKNKNVILITSKIYVSNKKFSYSDKRSIYSKEERFIQTIETINSIKKYIPDYFIILFDNSDFNNFEKTVLNNIVDCFLNIIDDDNLNYYTNKCKIKAYAEVSQQLKFFDLFIVTENNNLNKINNFYKISGRYLINDTFDFKQFNNDKTIFKKDLDNTKNNYYFTSFYKLDKNILIYYHNKLKYLLNNKIEYLDNDLEIILPDLIKKYISEIDNLGITQRIAVWNEISKI